MYFGQFCCFWDRLIQCSPGWPHTQSSACLGVLSTEILVIFLYVYFFFCVCVCVCIPMKEQRITYMCTQTLSQERTVLWVQSESGEIEVEGHHWLLELDGTMFPYAKQGFLAKHSGLKSLWVYLAHLRNKDDVISQDLVRMVCDVKQKVDDTTGVYSIIMFTLHKGNTDLELLHFISVINLIDNSVLFYLGCHFHL